MDSLKEALSRADAFLHRFEIDDSGVPYLQLAIGCLIVDYVFHTYLDLRQLKAVRTRDPPAELSHYTPEHLSKTRAYSVDKKRFAFVKGLADFLESLGTLYFFWLPILWGVSRAGVAAAAPQLANNEYVLSVVFFLTTSLLDTIKGLPWGWYYTFVIEERHGFNKQTLGLFVLDTLKSTGLTLLIAPPILCAVVYILKVSSPYMPLYLWLFVIALQLLAMTIYPTLIAPLFNKYEPLPEGTLRQGIEALASSLRFPLTKLYVVDGSKRSGHSNAYMYGFFKNKRIVLYDTLINQCSEDQVVAVLAHELGHWKLGHTICLMLSGWFVMLTQFVLFTMCRSSPHLLPAFGFHDEQPVIVSLTLFTMLYGPMERITGWLFNLLSRRFEFQADRFAVEMKHAEKLQEALKILDEENKSDFVVDRLYSAYHYSHPPMAERLRAIQTAAKKLL